MAEFIEPKFLRPKEFWEEYGIGKTSFFREIKAGRLKARKFGSATRIARADAEAWAAALPVREGGAK